MVDAATPAESLAMFRQGSVDALAGVRQALARAAAEGPYRVLDDSFTQIRQAVALPKSREAALPWLREFVRDAIRTGVIERGARDSGQTDVSLASAEPVAAG
jgi:polar amino acid transport system substrate-binding protein